MLLNILLSVAALSFGHHTAVDHDTTIIGKALNTKRGAVVVVNDYPYYINGSHTWDKEFYGKEVKVIGRVLILKGEKDVNKAGEKVQAITGDRKVIKKPKWALVR